jgi:hypothetical protein
MSVIRWAARILGLFSLAFILLFFFGEADFSQPLQLDPREIVMIIFFPIGVILGNLLGWWREGLGAIITISSFTAFYLADLIFSGTWPSGPYFALLASPGILFALYCLLSRKKEVARILRRLQIAFETRAAKTHAPS